MSIDSDTTADSVEFYFTLKVYYKKKILDFYK